MSLCHGWGSSHPVRALLLLLALALGGAAVLHGPAALHATPRASTETMAHYTAGWNIVSVPTGTSIDDAVGPLLTASPALDGYLSEAHDETIGGRAAWAFFANDTDIALGPTAAVFTQVHLRADKFAMIGNPSSTQTLTIRGADLAYSYDPQKGYQPATQLDPGQGAFVLSHTGGWVSVGDPPSAAFAAQMQSIQDGFTNDAADPSTFGQIPALAEMLISNRQFDAVQTTIDDSRAAFSDGLAKEQAATQPQLTTLQLSSTVSVRESLAEAQDDVAAGTPDLADAALSAARTQAQASEDEAAMIARGNQPEATPTPTPSASYLATTYTPQSLARYGNLCTASVPALSLALAPSPQLLALVVATLNNQPPPSS